MAAHCAGWCIVGVETRPPTHNGVLKLYDKVCSLALTDT